MSGRKYTDKQRDVVMSSPALREQANDYPSHWKGKVPAIVGILKTVSPDLPYSGNCVALEGEEYPVFVNTHGAVSAVFPGGQCLGLKPMEFVVIKFHITRGGAA